MENFDWHVENTNNGAHTKTNNNKSITNLKKRRICWNMKANFKNLFLASAALLMGLTACNNGDVVENIDLTETKTVKVSLNFDAPKSYAVSKEQTGGDGIVLKKASLFFCTADDGTITNVYHVEKDGNYETGTGTGDNATFGGTEDLFRVAASAKYVYVVANAADNTFSGNEYGVLGSIKDVYSKTLSVGTQASSDEGNVVHMYGGQFLGHDGVEQKDVTAETKVKLATNVARIEITKITSTSESIEAFTVDGIYVNEYLLNARVDADTPTDFLTNNYKAHANQLLPSNFTPTGSLYDGFSSNEVFDAPEEAATKVDETVKHSLVAGGTYDVPNKVWGYNLFASSKPFPSIVIRLSGVEISGTTITEPMFVTVKSVSVDDTTDLEGFDASTKKATKLVGSYVYKLGEISFSELHLSYVPNQNTIDASVTVEPAVWNPVSVKPEL